MIIAVLKIHPAYYNDGIVNAKTVMVGKCC